MLPDDLSAELKRQFTQRFVFAGYSIISIIIALVLVFLGWSHPYNTALVNGELIFAGFFNPYLLISGIVLFVSVAFYTIWMLRREQRIESPHVEMSTHTVLAIASVLIVLVLLNSAWMTETLKQVYGSAFMPQLPPPVPANILGIVSVFIFFTFVLHSVWYVYQVLLVRSLHRAEITHYPKKKRKNNLLSADDDREVFDPSDQIIHHSESN